MSVRTQFRVVAFSHWDVPCSIVAGSYAQSNDCANFVCNPSRSLVVIAIAAYQTRVLKSHLVLSRALPATKVESKR